MPLPNISSTISTFFSYERLLELDQWSDRYIFISNVTNAIDLIQKGIFAAQGYSHGDCRSLAQV